MRLFGLGKPNPARLLESGDVGGLAAALADRDADVAREAFHSLVDMAVQPQYRQHNAAALDALRKFDEARTIARFRELLDGIDAATSSWRNAAIAEALIVLGQADALERFFDRYVGGELQTGLMMLDVTGYLVRWAAANRDKRLLTKMLQQGPFGSPDGLRLGSAADDAQDAHLPLVAQLVPLRMGMREIGAIFCELASEEELLQVALSGRGGHAVPVVFDRVGERGTENALAALDQIAGDEGGQGRRAREAMAKIVSRLPSERLIARAEKDDRVALRILCDRGDPSAAHLISAAVSHDDESLATAAIRALGKMRAEGAAGVLVPLAADASEAKREAAIEALADLGTGEAADALLALPIARLLDSELVRPIIDAGRGAELVQRAGEEFATMDAADGILLVHALREAGLGNAIAPMQDRLAVAHVADLDAANWGARKQAAEALGDLGGPAAIAALESRAAREQDYELQRVLAEALDSARR